MTSKPNTATMRAFGTGATRNVDTDKHDMEGFISPLVLEGYSAYMHQHRTQADGSLRDSDNWQKGMPVATYRKSLIRHVHTAWSLWRGWPVKPEVVGTNKVTPTLKDALYAVLFNVMGYLHELEKKDLELVELARTPHETVRAQEYTPFHGSLFRYRVLDNRKGLID